MRWTWLLAKSETIELDLVIVDGTAEDAKHDLVGVGSRPQEKPPVDGSGAGLDDGTSFGNVAKRTHGTVLHVVGAAVDTRVRPASSACGAPAGRRDYP